MDCADLVSPIFRDDTFADVHNLDHCIKYLNQSLVTFGFPSGLNLYSSEPVSAVNYFVVARFALFIHSRVWGKSFSVLKSLYFFWYFVQLMAFYRVQLYEHVTAYMPWFSSGNGTSSIVKQPTRPGKGASTRYHSWYSRDLLKMKRVSWMCSSHFASEVHRAGCLT